MPKKQTKKSNFSRGNRFSNYSSNSNYYQYPSYYNSGFDYYDGNNSQYNFNYCGNYYNSFGIDEYYQNSPVDYGRYQQQRNYRYNNQQISYGNRWKNLNYQNPQGYYQNSYADYQNLQENYYDTHSSSQSHEENFQNLQENYDDSEESIPYQPDEGFVSRISLYRKVKSDSSVDDDFKSQYLNENNVEDITENEFREQGPSWTDGFWKKHQGEEALSDHEDNINTDKGKKPRKLTNKVEKTLAKMLAKPVEMSKGKSMLMKMGWDGGGLGKDGEGIVEPIAPKATYASTTMGLGNPSENAKPSKSFAEKKQTLKKRKKQIQMSESSDEGDFNASFQFKGRFKTNVLNTILNFVKNDLLVELKFEEKLSRNERRRVHRIVACLSGSEDLDNLSYMDEEHVEITKEILHYNKYLLTTQSDGEGVQRRISIFKEGLPHVYHIVPEDLRDEPDEENETEELEDDKNIKNNQNNKLKAEKREVTNQNQVFNNGDDKSDTGVTDNKNQNDIIDICNGSFSETNLQTNANGNKTQNKNKDEVNELSKNSTEINNQIGNGNIEYTQSNVNQIQNEEPKDILSLIVDYFVEFTKEKAYEEFRFLGPFNSQERQCIDEFFRLFNSEIEHEGKEKISEATNDESVTYNVVEDDNGSLFISKTPKDGESASDIYKKKMMERDWVQTLSFYDEC